MAHFGRQFVADLDAALAGIGSGEVVDLAGQWIASTRRIYRPSTDPFIEVVDQRWEGNVSSSAPVAGIAFACVDSGVYWVKSCPAATCLDVSIRMAAYANDTQGEWTASLSLGGSALPAVPATLAGTSPSLALAPGRYPACVALSILRTDSVELLVLVLPGRLLSVGRNRLWRLRDEHADGLPEPIHGLLTRRRAGRLTADS